MNLPAFVTKRLASLDQPDPESIAIAMRQFYERPIRFFRSFIGADLHYHLGHFPSKDVSLNQGMRNAVDALVAVAEGVAFHPRILDIGCGWGGPADQLITRLGASLVCMTISSRQACFTRRRLRRSNAKVYELDIEHDSLPELEPFDIIWVYESLEHMVDPGRVLRLLRSLILPNGKLLIATSCSGNAADTQLYSTHLGVQPLGTMEHLGKLLIENGWYPEKIVDCTEITLPGWEKWRVGLRNMRGGKFWQEAERLEMEYNVAEQLYAVSHLRSVQLMASPWK